MRYIFKHSYIYIIALLLSIANNILPSLCPITLQEAPGSPFAAPNTFPRDLVWSLDNRFLAVANQTTSIPIYSVDQTTGALSPIAGSPFAASQTTVTLEYTPDGKFLAASGFSNTIDIFSVNQSSGAITPIVGSPFTTSVIQNLWISYSPNGKFLASTYRFNNEVAIFSVAPSGAIAEIALSPFSTGPGTGPFGLEYSPDSRFLAVSLRDSNQVAVYSVDQISGAITPVAGSPFATAPGTRPRQVNFSPDGQYLAVVDSGNNLATVYSVNQATGTLTEITTAGSPFATGAGPAGVDYSPSGTLVAITNEAGFNVPQTPFPNTFALYTVDPITGAFTPINGTLASSVFPTGFNPVTIRFSPNSNFIATANSSTSSFPSPGSVSVYLINPLPFASDSTATTTCNQSVIITPTISGAGLTITSVGSPVNGITTISSPTEITYTPNANFSGTDTFPYTITDCVGRTATALITVTVSGPCCPILPGPASSLVDAIRNKYCPAC